MRSFHLSSRTAICARGGGRLGRPRIFCNVNLVIQLVEARITRPFFCTIQILKKIKVCQKTNLYLAQKERLEKALPFHLLRKSPILCPYASACGEPAYMDETSSSLCTIQIHKKIKVCQKTNLYLAQKERLEKALPFHLLRKSPILCPYASACGEPAYMDETSSSLCTIQIHKKTKVCQKTNLYLAQKERLELSRRLPDLRP